MIEKFTLSKGNQVDLKEFDPEDTGKLSKKDMIDCKMKCDK
jgi:hypothetical protein